MSHSVDATSISICPTPSGHAAQDSITLTPRQAIAQALKMCDLQQFTTQDIAALVWMVKSIVSGDEKGLDLLLHWLCFDTALLASDQVETLWQQTEGLSLRPATLADLQALVAKYPKPAGESTPDPSDDLPLDRDALTSAVLSGEAACQHTLATLDEEIEEPSASSRGTALDQYSLRNKLSQLESLAQAAIALLGQLVLLGQFVFIYAAANTGKTLLMFYLLVEAIGKGIIDPTKVYYINMDDNANGILDKLRIAEELGFHILADGLEEFSVGKFMRVLKQMIENGQAQGVVIVLDTYKKFANTMDKTQSRAFNSLLRRFVMAGGTVIALAHVNKNPGADGRARYAGTSDSLDDCDCAYMLTTISHQDGYKTVEFTNIKNRGGGVVDRAAYRYCSTPDQTYPALLGSVEPVDSPALDQLKFAEVVRSDAEVISAVQDCIQRGVATKMKIAATVAQRTGVSRKAVIEVLEKYCGDDPEAHRWRFRVRGHGAKVFEVIDTALAYTFEDGGT